MLYHPLMGLSEKVRSPVAYPTESQSCPGRPLVCYVVVNPLTRFTRKLFSADVFQLSLNKFRGHQLPLTLLKAS